MSKFKLFSVPISITSKPQALALVGEWVKEWSTANHSENSENSNSRKVRQSENQKSGIRPSGSLIFRSSDVSGFPSIPSFPKIVVTPNPEMIVAAQKDPEFLRALQAADLAIPDGVGIVWALKILKGRRTKDEGRRKYGNVSSRPSAFSFQPSALSPLSGLDFMESLIGESAKNGWKVMLLGGKPGVAEKAAKILSEHSENSDCQTIRKSPVLDQVETRSGDNQTVRISGSLPRRQAGPSIPSFLKIKSLSGPQNISTISKSQNDRLITSINQVQPHLLFVAFGHGKQEKWMAANRRRLRVGVMMGVGGALDQIADPSLRPPVYTNSIGLGWLYRLLRQPWRWRRQLSLIKFIGMVLLKRYC